MFLFLEPAMEWECWRMKNVIICGRQSYPALMFLLLVKPSIFETDPGPLDAGVP